MFCIYVPWSKERITKLKNMMKMFWKMDDVEKSNGDVEMIVVNPPMNTLLPIDFMQPLISTLLELSPSNEAMTMCSTKSTKSPRDMMIAINVIGLIKRSSMYTKKHHKIFRIDKN